MKSSIGPNVQRIYMF